MCCRYAYWDSTTIHEQYHVAHTDVEIKANYNTTPHSHIPVIIEQYMTTDAHTRRVRALEIMQWGLIPEWAKPEKIKGFFNARQETIAKKPSFKVNFKLRRCIVPARGFYEWNKNTKQPFYISTPHEHMAFAGIWDGGSSGIVPTVAIITTNATTLHHIHDRIPVVLNSHADIDAWLDPLSRERELLQMLSDANDTLFRWHPIHRTVNHPQNNNEGLIKEMIT